MAFRVFSQVRDGVGILSVEGEFKLGVNGDFRSLATQLAADPKVNSIEIDLEHAVYLDSSALGLMLAARDQAHRQQKSITLTNCRGEVRRVLDIASFGRLFAILP